MLWLKAFHIIFVVMWFAGLFYLPRLFVYHAMCEDAVGRERFMVMQRKLFAIMSIGGLGAVVFGIGLLWWWATRTQSYFSQGWLHLKLALVVGLIAYHVWCFRLMRNLAAGRGRSHVWYRWFNEVPALALFAIVILVVVKPTLSP